MGTLKINPAVLSSFETQQDLCCEFKELPKGTMTLTVL